ncbi:hypothetical protein EMCRGX_G022436 [Ephydatia muelleri]
MHGNYTPHWAVQIRGGRDVADRLATKHGFMNMGLIANLENVYDFKLSDDVGDKREPMSEKTLALSQEPEVGFVEQQYYRKMVPKTRT